MSKYANAMSELKMRLKGECNPPAQTVQILDRLEKLEDLVLSMIHGETLKIEPKAEKVKRAKKA